MNSITLIPEQFIFASDNTLKTTSLKIAERFGKDHSNVLKAIDKILTQVSDSFRKVNFNVSEYEQENQLGLMVKYRYFELTRDGFMIVVMSFTGKDAMEIKEWYINAFNLMHEKLFPRLQPAPLSLPNPRARKAIKGGLLLEQQDQINDLIKERLLTLPPGRRGALAMRIYSAINTKFDTRGMKDGYKNIAPEHFDNILQLIARVPLEESNLLTFTVQDFETKIAEITKTIEGVVLPEKKTESTLSISLAELGPGESERFYVHRSAGMTMIQKLDTDMLLQLSRQAFERDGYLVIKKSEIVPRLTEL